MLVMVVHLNLTRPPVRVLPQVNEAPHWRLQIHHVARRESDHHCRAGQMGQLAVRGTQRGLVPERETTDTMKEELERTGYRRLLPIQVSRDQSYLTTWR